MQAAPSGPDVQDARQAFYDRISQQHQTPLWTSLANLVTPEPRSPYLPASLRASHNCGTKCHVPSLEEGVETAETPGDGFRAGWLVAA